MRKLAICIPVYNNAESFENSLKAACESCKFFADVTEIVVSDNNSEEQILAIVERCIRIYNDVQIIYYRNETNIGMAANFLQAASYANSEFCWIIGSDDFVYSDSVQIVLSVIDSYRNVDFICCNFNLAHVKDWEHRFSMRELGIGHDSVVQERKAPVRSGEVEKLGDLVRPEMNNVYLGSIMTGIFRKNVWDSVDKSTMELNGFNTLDSTYPHCKIYARGFINRKAYYCEMPLIVVGEGVREWSTDKDTPFWKSSLPVIYFNVLGSMLDEYLRYGLSKANYNACMKENAYRVGDNFRALVYLKWFKRGHIKNGTMINPLRVLFKYGKYVSFYYAAFPAIMRLRKRIGGQR